MDLTDIQPLDKWIELEKDIYKRSGLASNVFNVDGIKITDNKVSVNRLCPVIQAHDSGQSFICAVANMNIADMAKNSKETVIEECDAGLLKLVVPIFIKEEFLGSVSACGLLLDDGDIDSFIVNRTIEIGEEKVEELSDDIKRVTTDDVEALGKYITERVEKIIDDFEHNM